MGSLRLDESAELYHFTTVMISHAITVGCGELESVSIGQLIWCGEKVETTRKFGKVYNRNGKCSRCDWGAHNGLLLNRND